MNNDKNSGSNHLDFERHPPTLPDFDTLRDMAKNDPDSLEKLRVALCDRVINEAPEHAKPRLRGLMFHINSRRKICTSAEQATAEISSRMNESLQRMQAMLKDLRMVQSESILLTTKNHNKPAKDAIADTATVLPFRRR